MSDLYDESERFMAMAGLEPGSGPFYDLNMDALAEGYIQGLGGGPAQPWWPSWLRLRMRTRPWIIPPQPDPNPFPRFRLRRDPR